jgi:hypothetical protein
MIDRRTFLGRAGIAAGAAAVAGFAPLASVHAAQPLESDEFRHVDDMWGHWPRYSHPIPHACSQTETVSREKADLIDRMWVS